MRLGLSMQMSVDTHVRSGHLIGNDTLAAAQSTRVHDNVSREADALIVKIIRENSDRGGDS